MMFFERKPSEKSAARLDRLENQLAPKLTLGQLEQIADDVARALIHEARNRGPRALLRFITSHISEQELRKAVSEKTNH
jgi:hypothetical protein